MQVPQTWASALMYILMEMATLYERNQPLGLRRIGGFLAVSLTAGICKRGRNSLYATATMNPGPTNFPKVTMPLRTRDSVQFWVPWPAAEATGWGSEGAKTGVVEGGAFTLPKGFSLDSSRCHARDEAVEIGGASEGVSRSCGSCAPSEPVTCAWRAVSPASRSPPCAGVLALAP